MTTRRQRGTMRTRRGVSLVEVLIVVVLLVIGIFAIARLFPEGFFSIDHTGNRTRAGAFARLNEDYLREFREYLPQAIVALDPNQPGVVRGAIPPGEYYSGRQYIDNPVQGATTPPDDPRYSGPNIARRVLGEQVKIPPATPGIDPGSPSNTNGAVSLYHVLFSPIYSDVPLGGGGAGVSASSGTPMQRVIFQDPPTEENVNDLVAQGPFGYGINYDRGVLYFLSAQGFDRDFNIEYTYHWSIDGAGQTRPGNALRIAAGRSDTTIPTDRYGNVDLAVFDLRTDQSVGGINYLAPRDDTGNLVANSAFNPSSDILYRRFRQLQSGDPFTTDPFEFKVYDTVFGLIGFNPRLSYSSMPRQQGRGLVARIDYDVDDWYILRQDEVVPLETLHPAGLTSASDTHVLKLSTGAIKRYLDVEDTVNFGGRNAPVPTTFEYQGLIRFYPAGATTPSPRQGSPGIDLIIVDLETGLQIDSSTLQRQDGNQPPGSNNSNGEISYRAGIIHLVQTPNWRPPGSPFGAASHTVSMSAGGRHVRLYYRSGADFAVATSKPYVTYHRQPILNQLADQEFTPVVLNAQSPGQPFGVYLLFNTSEVDRTVAVDYSYLDPATGRAATEIGEMHRINQPDSGVPMDPNAGPAWIRLGHSDDAGIDPDTFQVTGVRGASLLTRVVWRDANRTRHIERTTLLTREQTR